MSDALLRPEPRKSLKGLKLVDLSSNMGRLYAYHTVC
jgi:hypothetical protein